MDDEGQQGAGEGDGGGGRPRPRRLRREVLEDRGRHRPPRHAGRRGRNAHQAARALAVGRGVRLYQRAI
eukprot:160337-Pleurochrysis_carterae.AAC.1